MFIPADPMLYFYLLLGQQYVTNDIQSAKPYQPYTTNIVMSNKDMYDVNKVIEQVLLKEVEQEKRGE